LPFNDVSTGDWFYKYVSYAYEHKILSGTSATTFEPDTVLTRAMVVTSLYSAEGKPSVSTDAGFNDLKDDWYKNAVNWAASEGIVAGVGNGKFAPTVAITREQLALILYKYTKYKGYDVSGSADLSSFKDAGKVDGWAATGVKWAVQAGVISGKGGGLLDPTEGAKRSEFATMMANVGSITNDFESKDSEKPKNVPEDALEYNNHYYKAYTDKLSWEDAEKYCEDNGGHLATISDKDEDAFVKTVVSRYTNSWIGGRLDDEGFDYLWVTGEPFSYTNWGSRTEVDANRIYFERYYDDYEWNQASKYSTYGFICEWDNQTIRDAFPLQSVAPADSYEYNGHHYKTYTKKYTWQVAEALCEKHGGHLVTINDQGEDAFIKTIVGRYTENWIGGRLDDEGLDYLWVTEEPFSYQNWGSNKEVDSDRIIFERYDDGYEWNQASKFSTKYFICEWDDQKVKDTFSLQSDVAADSYEYNSHHYKAYATKLTWQAAKDICEKHGGHLATITDKDEDAFLKTIVSRYSKYWIGGYFNETKSDYSWITDETFSYTDWGGSNEANANRIVYERYDEGYDWFKANDLSTYWFICEWDK